MHDNILYNEVIAAMWHYQSIVVADGVRGSKVELSYILTSLRQYRISLVFRPENFRAKNSRVK